jgi:hypothetical protein
MFQSHSDSGAGLSGCATANRIDDHHYDAAARRKDTIDIGGGARLLDSILGQIAAHGREKLFRVRHRL